MHSCKGFRQSSLNTWASLWDHFHTLGQGEVQQDQERAGRSHLPPPSSKPEKRIVKEMRKGVGGEVLAEEREKEGPSVMCPMYVIKALSTHTHLRNHLSTQNLNIDPTMFSNAALRVFCVTIFFHHCNWDKRWSHGYFSLEAVSRNADKSIKK